MSTNQLFFEAKRVPLVLVVMLSTVLPSAFALTMPRHPMGFASPHGTHRQESFRLRAFPSRSISQLLLLDDTGTPAASSASDDATSDRGGDMMGDSSYYGINAVVGEADRAFRSGVQLERNGQARAASAAFHEAATLYQCFCEAYSYGRSSEFRHVTALSSPEEASPILAYTCVRLAHLSHDALGDAKAASRLYKDATLLDPHPSAVSFDGLGTSIEASGGSLEEAVQAYREALKISNAKGLSHESRQQIFHLAVALERVGEAEEAERYLEELRRSEAQHSCLVDSWGYVRWHTRKVPNGELNLHRGTRDILEIALSAAMPLIHLGGLVCEFGVASGRSLRMTQELLPLGIPVHGFDTFTGLPQAWGDEPKGSHSTGGKVPNMEGDVFFHKGLFRDTIPAFMREPQNKDAFLAYANIDCHLYTSTLDILEGLHGKIIPGSILVFDEYLCHPTWRQDEFRAFRECCKRFGWQYEYLGFSLTTKQAVVRITDA